MPGLQYVLTCRTLNTHVCVFLNYVQSVQFSTGLLYMSGFKVSLVSVWTSIRKQLQEVLGFYWSELYF